VRRKVEAINAWVDYAWKIEPKEPKHRKAPAPPTEIAKQAETLQVALEVPGHGRTIAPKPWYASMIQDPISPSAMPPDAAVAQEPPPSYTTVDNGRFSNAAIPGVNGTGALPVCGRLTPRARHECIFCGRRFTRKGTMWNCAERHLKRRPTDAVPCPDPGCKSKGIVLKNELQFKNHAKLVHNRDLKPKVTIRMTLNSPTESTRSTPKIILTPTKQHRRISLRGGDPHRSRPWYLIYYRPRYLRST